MGFFIATDTLAVMSTDSAAVTHPGEPPAAEAEPARPRRGGAWFSSADLGPAATILVALAVIGVLLGLLWAAISPRTKGFVYLPNAVIPEESESLIAADGRFLLLTGAAGIVVAVAAWMRRSARGPATALALIAGGLLGALLTDFIGRLVSGGHDTGTLNTVVTLPLRVHARGLLLIEAALAAFIYAACALFARRDDLGVAEADAAAPPRLVDVWPTAGESVDDWATPRIDVTLDRAAEGDADWIRAFARSADRYEPLTLEPATTAPGPDGGVTYSFVVADPPGERPLDVLVQLRRPQVDAQALDEHGQWTFTVMEPDAAP
jgi:hypothetical protein